MLRVSINLHPSLNSVTVLRYLKRHLEMRKGNTRLWMGEDHDNNFIDLKISAHQIPVTLLSAEQTMTQGSMSFSKQQFSEHRGKINASGKRK